MNLDELIQLIPDTEPSKESLNIAIQYWKENDAQIQELVNSVNKWHGNVWLETQGALDFWDSWLEFREKFIDGMTCLSMDERLCIFGLNEKWGKASESAKQVISHKLQVTS